MGKRADHARAYQARFRPHAGFILAHAAFAAIFVTLVLSAFHAPSPHAIPVGVVAPATVTGQVEDALDASVQGGFDLRVYPSEARARTGIAHREVDGALIVSGRQLRLLVAQAGGTGPAQALTKVFDAIAAKSGRPLTVTDVAPPLADDSEALSPFFIILGVLIPSLAAGSASALVFRRARPGRSHGPGRVHPSWPRPSRTASSVRACTPPPFRPGQFLPALSLPVWRARPRWHLRAGRALRETLPFPGRTRRGWSRGKPPRLRRSAWSSASTTPSPPGARSAGRCGWPRRVPPCCASSTPIM